MQPGKPAGSQPGERIKTMTTKKEVISAGVIAPLTIDLTVAGGLDSQTRETLDQLAYALQHQGGKCDAIGECGRKCNLRAGHPGEIHENYSYGMTTRFALVGECWKA